MQKVKPVLPPKPKCSSPSLLVQGYRLNSGFTIESTSSTVVDSASATRGEPDGGISADGEENLANGEPLHVTTSLSTENICHGLPQHEIDRLPRQGPRTAPKPKSHIKTDLVQDTKSVSSMTSSCLVDDTLPVVDSTDSDATVLDCKAGNTSEAKVSVTIADMTAKHGSQMNVVPVKPSRPKKTLKQASLSQGTVNNAPGASKEAMHEVTPVGKRGGESQADRKDKCQLSSPETKAKPKHFVNVPESDDSLLEKGKGSRSSADSGRLYRSQSYERALEDEVFRSGFVEAEHSKGKEEEGKKRMADIVLSDVKAVSDISGNYLVPNHLKERVSENVQGDRKDFGCIQPSRVAPPPPSKANAPILKRKPKDSDHKGVAPDYIDLQSKSSEVPNASTVARSSSDRSWKKSLLPGKPGHAKEKHRKKSGDAEKGRSENGRHSESVFYVNLGDTTSGLNEKNLESYCQKKVHVDSGGYLLPEGDLQNVTDSEGNTDDSFYENTQATTPQAKKKNSTLDTLIPVPGKNVELTEELEPDNTSNDYYEISELDNPVPVQAMDEVLVDEEGYSMITDPSDIVRDDNENADTDYIYPENWTPRAHSSRVSDTYIYPVDEAGKALSPKSMAVVRPQDMNDLQYVSEETDSRRSSWLCDSALQSPDCSLSRNSSILSNSTFQTMDASPGELTEEDIKLNVEKKKRKAFLTAQEIVTSEKTFVDVLRLLSQDFISAVNQASLSLGKQVVSQSVLSQIIKYLPELQKFNEELLEDLATRLNNWEIDPRVADIFVKKGAFLKLYTNYIREFNSMVALLDENRRKNPDFDRAVSDFEASHCSKLALKHYMLKPIQRIPQYRLLLTDYQKQLSEESPDFKDANMAILIVNEVAEHANESMKYGDNLNKLLEIQNSLIGQFEVIVPGRTLLKDGILMKLSRKEMQPRMFYLFSDVLLYTTPVGGGYKLNNVLPLSTVKVSDPKKEDFQNEFSIISTQRSFTVAARTEQEKVEWLTAMEEAISIIRNRRTSYCKGKLTVPSIVSIDIDPMDFKLGTKAPVWIPDDRVSMCMICRAEFSLLFRRHHCRSCGKVVCATCSNYEAPLRYLQYKPGRVCSECFPALNKMIDEMEDCIPEEDVVSPQGDQPAELNRFSKRSIKSHFRSFAVEGGTPKPVQLKRPAVLQEINANDDNAEMSGYLHLWKDRKWKKTWFVLKEKVLYTFKASEDAAAEKSTPLLGYEITPFNTYFQGVEPNLIFELCHRGMPSVIFKTESPQSRDRWMSAMRSATMP